MLIFNLHVHCILLSIHVPAFSACFLDLAFTWISVCRYQLGLGSRTPPSRAPQVPANIGQTAGSTSQQQRILVAGPTAAAVANVSGGAGGSSLTALQRRSVIATQPTALTASTLRRSSSSSTIASVGSAQNSPRILQRPQGNTVQMASLIRQQQLTMTQVAAKRGNSGQGGAAQVAGVSASGQPTASARIQALAATATTVSVGTQPAGGQPFRTGISVNTQGASESLSFSFSGNDWLVLGARR